MHQSTFEFTNDGEEPVEVTFEPYGMPYLVPPGATFRILAQGEVVGELNVETAGGCTSVYSWPSSTAKVYIGSRLVGDHDTPVPGLPTGMSTRGFVDLMFGEPGSGQTEEVPDAE